MIFDNNLIYRGWRTTAEPVRQQMLQAQQEALRAEQQAKADRALDLQARHMLRIQRHVEAGGYVTDEMRRLYGLEFVPPRSTLPEEG